MKFFIMGFKYGRYFELLTPIPFASFEEAQEQLKKAPAKWGAFIVQSIDEEGEVK